MESKGTAAVALLVLRLVLGSVMLAHGIQKMGWLPGGEGSLQGTIDMFQTTWNIPAALAYASTAAELIGGALLILGLLGRLAAFAVAINMAVAVFLVHVPKGFFAADGGTEFPLSLLAMAIALLMMGMGSVSLDAMLAQRMGGSKTPPASS